MTLKEIAAALGCRLEGDGDIDVCRVAGIEHAGPGDLTLAAGAKYYRHLATSRASAIIVDDKAPAAETAALLRCAHPMLAFARALGYFAPPETPPLGIDPLSSLAEDAVIGNGVSIGPFVTIAAGVSIGDRTIVYPNVVIGPGAQLGEDCVVRSHVSLNARVRVGNRVILHDGAVLGSEGFGFVKAADGMPVRIPQHGDVIIEDDVEIGANTAIDRPAVGETRIKAGAKIDNLVQIAHGVSIGHRTILAAQVGIAGSSVVEDDVTLGGQVGVADHVRLGRGVTASAQTGIPSSVEAGTFVSGYPAIDNRSWLKSSAVFRQLPALKKRVADLEHRILELEEMLACRTSPDR